MNSLTITLNNIPEVVTNALIEKLCELNKISSNVTLEGNLLVTKAYRDSVEYLTNHNQNLQINVTGDYYIRFTDSEVDRVLKTEFGDGTGLTEATANSLSSFQEAFRNNTSILTFDELNKFGMINLSYYGHYASARGDFEGCTNLRSVNLSNITAIKGPSFKNCTNLLNLGNFKPITLKQDGLAYSYAFYGCSSLTSCNLSDCISIGNAAFQNCTSLSNIQSLSNVEQINQNAFSGCSSLNIVLNLPSLGSDGNTTLGRGAFCRSGITSVTNLGYITTLLDGSSSNSNDGCFAYCSNLTSITLPSTLTYIGDFSFISDTSLTSISGYENVTTIKGKSFFECTGLINLIFNFSNVTSITDNVFKKAKIKQIYLPNITITSPSSKYDNGNYSSGEFDGSEVSLIYLKNITKVFCADFCKSKINAIVINNNTPPTVGYSNDNSTNTASSASPTNLFNRATIGAIYVPDSYISAYQSDPIWGTQTILGISQLNKVATKTAYDLLTALLQATTLIEEYM